MERRRGLGVVHADKAVGVDAQSNVAAADPLPEFDRVIAAMSIERDAI